MMEDLQAAGSGAIARLAELLLEPGAWLWQLLEHHAPAIAGQLAGGAAEPGTEVLAGLSALCGVAALLAVVAAHRLARMALRTGARLLARARFRIGNALVTLRTRVVCRLKRLSWRERESGTVHEQVDLDPLDLAVLQRGAGLPPGFAISVAEIAEQLRRRPAQVQRSLDKLHGHQLVNPLLGSTDGFGNYRLTDSGAWFVAACRRNRERALAAGGDLPAKPAR